MMVNLLQRGYDYLMDVEVEHEILRFENLANDCKMVFGDDFELGKSNHSDDAEVELSDQELEMVKMLNPYEWELYK